ncbi:type II secretion system protein GspG [Candidatus Uabimicrobium sp. HlEnr_7]|uniref:type II secretion system protein GspG n=1 Tax=Candidatus Uabimicrobium helgolandensis TaxID=3095367 RepID=UPI0035571B74
MKCQNVQLYKYICGELQQQEILQVTEHLTCCSQCSKKHRNIQQQLEEFKEWEHENSNISTEEIFKTVQKKSRRTRYIAWGIVSFIFVFLILIGLDIARYRHEHILISELEKAIVQYRLYHGKFPKQTAKLVQELKKVKSSDYYLQVWQKRIDPNGNFCDYWGNPIIYRFPAKYNLNFFDLYSCGKDSEDDNGLDDDIKNWHPLYEKK